MKRQRTGRLIMADQIVPVLREAIGMSPLPRVDGDPIRTGRRRQRFGPGEQVFGVRPSGRHGRPAWPQVQVCSSHPAEGTAHALLVNLRRRLRSTDRQPTSTTRRPDRRLTSHDLPHTVASLLLALRRRGRRGRRGHVHPWAQPDRAHRRPVWPPRTPPNGRRGVRRGGQRRRSSSRHRPGRPQRRRRHRDTRR